jgi:hypothetical protein
VDQSAPGLAEWTHCDVLAKVRLLPAAVHPQRHAMKQTQVRRKWMRAILQEMTPEL